MKLPHKIHSGNILVSITITILITCTAYIFSTFTNFPTIQYQMLFAFLFGLILVTFLSRQVTKLEKITYLVVYLLTGSILMLVATTGWFKSPFIFTIYLLVIVQSFFFPAIVSIVQVAVLLGLVAAFPEVGTISHDFLLILSLLGLIPVSYYLREQYLHFKESDNSIVILKKGTRKYSDTVEELVDNEIHRFSAKLRETLTNIKLQAYKIDTTVDLSKKKQIEHEITTETTRALKLLKDFEEDTTGSRVISNPKTSSHGR